MDGVSKDMMGLHGDVTTLSTDMQTGAVALQTIFGKAGDPQAAAIMQLAKVFAGELEQAAESAAALKAKMDDLTSSGAALKGSDFTKYTKATEAENITNYMEEATSAGEAKSEELEDLKAEAAPDTVSGSFEMYYPVMYFVDKNFTDAPSTCSGDVIGKPFTGNATTCASVCNANVGSCLGYSYIKSDDIPAGGFCSIFFKSQDHQ